MTNFSLRQALIEHLGHFPEYVAPTIMFETEEDTGDVIRRLITYMVEPGERISAWLLYPKGNVPVGGWPSILAIHQHAGQFHLGKSEPAGLMGDPTYYYGLELCQRGYVVLCPDMLCFEERRPAEENSLRDYNYERFEFTQRIVHGSCLQTKYLHDLTCALNVIASLPSVDATRLGVIGHSLGGQEALWLSWYDARVVATVSSCGFGLIKTILRDRINHNLAVYVPGILDICDMDALAATLAPRAFMLTAGETDAIFPIDGVRMVIANTQKAYTRQGVPEHFQAAIFPAGHSFPANVKEQAYTFLDRWLK